MADQDSRTTLPTVLLGGGIGAGKTRISELFAEAGFLVISSDEVGRHVLSPGAPAVAAVASVWPDVVSDGVVDRAALAAYVFADEAELRRLEQITHPAIEAAIARQLEATDTPVVVEVPVMSVLAGADLVRVAVIADADIRLQRAIERGGVELDIRTRMTRQPSSDQWRDWASYVIESSGDWSSTRDSTVGVIEAVMTDG